MPTASEIFSEAKNGVGRIEFSRTPGRTTTGTVFLYRNHLVTCDHVVEGLTARLQAQITFSHPNSDGNNYKFPLSGSRIASGNVYRSNKGRLDAIAIDPGDSFSKRFNFERSQNAPKVGDRVYTIGYPYGQMAASIHMGMVSSIFDEHGVQLLQLDMSINPSNSGGPLLNDQGKIIGIICMKSTGLSRAFDQLKSATDSNIAQLQSNMQGGGRVLISGLDPIAGALATQQQMRSVLDELEQSANVGIGYAKPLNMLLDAVDNCQIRTENPPRPEPGG